MPRTLAIGDIHGCLRAFDALLKVVDVQPDDLLITLGDYIDRGLDSRGVVDRVNGLREKCRGVAIRGNHEEMLLDARKGGPFLKFWLNCGGEAALVSYDPSADNPTLALIPTEHWEFFGKTCVDVYETETHIFVHGGVLAHALVISQSPSVLRWQFFRQQQPHMSKKVVICGHTPQDTFLPNNVGHAICIDTNVVHRDGWLTCLHVETGNYWQANERGQSREGKLA